MGALRWLALCVGLALGAAPPAAPQPMSLATVMHRASLFAIDQRDALTRVRADEHYLQEMRVPPRRSDDGLLKSRRLESEMAFVQLTDREEWLAFRNVMRVDGASTGTDTALLEKLFRQGAAIEQGRRIAEENAIYNLGRLHRTFNIPTVVNHFLMPLQRDRFSFKKQKEVVEDGELRWVIEYVERARPTIVRSTEHADVPVKGIMWIAPEDGRLVKATLEASSPVRSSLSFTWRRDANLNAWVPAEMREHYRNVSDKQSTYDIVAVATYSNYRRFAVDYRIK